MESLIHYLINQRRGIYKVLRKEPETRNRCWFNADIKPGHQSLLFAFLAVCTTEKPSPLSLLLFCFDWRLLLNRFIHFVAPLRAFVVTQAGHYSTCSDAPALREFSPEQHTNIQELPLQSR